MAKAEESVRRVGAKGGTMSVMRSLTTYIAVGMATGYLIRKALRRWHAQRGPLGHNQPSQVWPMAQSWYRRFHKHSKPPIAGED